MFFVLLTAGMPISGRKMKHQPAWFLFLVFFLVCSGVTIGQEKMQARIASWYHGLEGAVSISFDDAGYTQYSAACPVLEKYNLKATFGIVGEWVQEEATMSAEPDQFEIKKMGWQQLVELSEHGHELAAHGYLHRRYDKYAPVDSLAALMTQIRSLIESRTGHRVFTIHYPYSYASYNIPLAAEEAGYLFGRTGLDSVNPASPDNMYLLSSRAILNSGNPDPAMFRRWLDDAKGRWLILMYHHLFPEDSKEMSLIREHRVENSYSILPEAFEMQVKELTAQNLWIAPVASVGKYILERDSTNIRIIRTPGQMIIVTTTNLDTRIFNHPLTLITEIPWEKVSVAGSRQDGTFEATERRLLIDIDPESVIILTKAK